MGDRSIIIRRCCLHCSISRRGEVEKGGCGGTGTDEYWADQLVCGNTSPPDEPSLLRAHSAILSSSLSSLSSTLIRK